MSNNGLISGSFSSDTTLSVPVAINKGGTGQTTAQAALDALAAASGSLVQGDIFIVDSSGNVVRLARGSDDQSLVMNGSNPNWETASGGAATSYLQAGAFSAFSASVTNYLGWNVTGGARTSTEANVQLTFGTGFTLKRISASSETNSRDSATTIQFRDDESSVGNILTIPAGNTGLFQNSADTQVIADGSNCCFQLETTAGSGSISTNGIMIEMSI